jgi:hypothetical protein
MAHSTNRKYNRLKWILPACVIGICSVFATLPIDELPEKVMKALEEFAKRNPQEKVYLHTDRDYYSSGETIWFKAYVMMQNAPSLSATNLYVELLDKKGNIAMKKLLPVGGAGASGNFVLPDTLSAGNYQLRAYTAWMLNFDQDYLFYKDIAIYDARKRNSPETPDSNKVMSNDFAVQFFPEGGNLLTGVSSTVAFKAINTDGLPIEISGKIVDNKGKVVAQIKSEHDGMGTFELEPAKGVTYKAQLQSAAGGNKDFTLPAAADKGAILKVFNKGARIFYQTALANSLDTAYDDLMVFAQMQHQMVYRANLKASEGRISGFIPTNQLPTGIVQITLFNSKGLPLSERLVFVRQNDQLDLSLQNADIGREEREKGSIELFVPEKMATSLSVSITDADRVMPAINENNIVSSLLLTSDLKGYINNPAWYFKDTAVTTLHALDLVMLTNGWRRFTWTKILNDTMPNIRYPYEQGIRLKGSAFANNGAYPMANGKVDFIIKNPLDSTTSFASAPTDNKGDFVLDGLGFLDTVNIFYQGNDKMKRYSNVVVRFNNHFFDNSVPVKTPFPYMNPVVMDAKTLGAYLNLAYENGRIAKSIASRSILLKEFTVAERKVTAVETTEKRYVSGMFTSDNGYSFDLTKETPTALNVFQYLQSRVAGLQITGDYNNPSMSWRGGEPTLYLNEMPTDKSMISTININDIALVKVFRPPFMGGIGGGSNGAIAIYTKKGGDNRGDDGVKGFELYKKAGYSIVKEFYSPDYSQRKEIYSLPDKRLTLYWNPNVVVDSITHTATIKFYNNDVPARKFRVVVEGIGEDGRLGHIEQTY